MSTTCGFEEFSTYQWLRPVFTHIYIVIYVFVSTDKQTETLNRLVVEGCNYFGISPKNPTSCGLPSALLTSCSTVFSHIFENSAALYIVPQTNVKRVYPCVLGLLGDMLPDSGEEFSIRLD